MSPGSGTTHAPQAPFGVPLGSPTCSDHAGTSHTRVPPQPRVQQPRGHPCMGTHNPTRVRRPVPQFPHGRWGTRGDGVGPRTPGFWALRAGSAPTPPPSPSNPSALGSCQGFEAPSPILGLFVYFYFFYKTQKSHGKGRGRRKRSAASRPSAHGAGGGSPCQRGGSPVPPPPATCATAR